MEPFYNEDLTAKDYIYQNRSRPRNTAFEKTEKEIFLAGQLRSDEPFAHDANDTTEIADRSQLNSLDLMPRYYQAGWCSSISFSWLSPVFWRKDLAIPFFIKEIMIYISDDTGQASRDRAIVFTLLILIGSIFLRITREYLMFYQQILGINAGKAMVGFIYEKILRVSSATNKGHSIGEICTFIQVDAPKLNRMIKLIIFNPSLKKVDRP